MKGNDHFSQRGPVVFSFACVNLFSSNQRFTASKSLGTSTLQMANYKIIKKLYYTI